MRKIAIVHAFLLSILFFFLQETMKNTWYVILFGIAAILLVMSWPTIDDYLDSMDTNWYVSPNAGKKDMPATDTGATVETGAVVDTGTAVATGSAETETGAVAEAAAVATGS